MSANENNVCSKQVRRAAATVVESLEGRQLMSVTWSSGNLTVNGTNSPDTIVVETMPMTANLSLVRVTENGAVTQQWMPFAAGKKLTVNGKGGADKIDCYACDVPVTVDGGTGNDTIYGGTKNDTLKGGDNNDTINGFAGNDTIDGGNNEDSLTGGWGADKFVGGAGTDTADYSLRADALMLSINGIADDGALLEMDNIGLDVENIVGGYGNDIISGDADPNKIQGLGGGDLIYGQGGADTIYGGKESEQYQAGVDHPTRDLIYGGDGVNLIFASVNGSSEIFGGNQNDTIYGNQGRDALHGDAGNDTIDGRGGDDQLWGGAGDDTLKGGEGDDTLVTIGGGRKDKLYGNAGFDSFWLDQPGYPYVEEAYDASVEEISAGHIHQVEDFHTLHYNTTGYDSLPPNQLQFVDKELDDATLADPMQTNGGTKWANFSDKPLFADNGTTGFAGDVRQGSKGDTWFSAALSAVARANPDRIRQTVVDLGDGTFAVNFGAGEIYRVDADLPVDGSGKPIYLGTGKDACIWPAIIEKAFAFARDQKGTYKSIAEGEPEEAFEALRCTGVDAKMGYQMGNNADQKLAAIKKLLDEGKVVTFHTVSSISSFSLLESDHTYDVVAVHLESNPSWIELRNPWGVDGGCEDGTFSNPNDGYLELHKSFLNDLSFCSWANK